jgi:EpsD family peptidyl-prolyl cis-trans isomerase
LKHFDVERNRANLRFQSLRLLPVAGFVVAAIALSACGEKAEKKPGQALVSVNGKEITVLQLNDELSRVNPQVAQQESSRKQLIEALVDRELLVSEANKEKLDRDPKVVQSIERAKATILAQAYLQRRIGQPTRPTRPDVEAYYNKNPQFFAQRKQFDLSQLIVPTSALNDEVKKVIDSSKSLDEVATWLANNKVKFNRAQISRTSTDLPAQLTAKLLTMSPGQLFIVREGDRSLLMSIAGIKDVPMSLDAAAPQIEQFLLTRENKEKADAEIKRLRAAAKIEYLDSSVKPAAAATPPATESTAIDRGAAGLK